MITVLGFRNLRYNYRVCVNNVNKAKTMLLHIIGMVSNFKYQKIGKLKQYYDAQNKCKVTVNINFT